MTPCPGPSGSRSCERAAGLRKAPFSQHRILGTAALILREPKSEALGKEGRADGKSLVTDDPIELPIQASYSRPVRSADT